MFTTSPAITIGGRQVSESAPSHSPAFSSLAERPPAILCGFSFGHPRLMEPDRVRVHADTAMQAGLFGIAANYFGERWPVEAAQARDAAHMHIERARALG